MHRRSVLLRRYDSSICIVCALPFISFSFNHSSQFIRFSSPLHLSVSQQCSVEFTSVKCGLYRVCCVFWSVLSSARALVVFLLITLLCLVPINKNNQSISNSSSCCLYKQLVRLVLIEYNLCGALRRLFIIFFVHRDGRSHHQKRPQQ